MRERDEKMRGRLETVAHIEKREKRNEKKTQLKIGKSSVTIAEE